MSIVDLYCTHSPFSSLPPSSFLYNFVQSPSFLPISSPHYFYLFLSFSLPHMLSLSLSAPHSLNSYFSLVPSLSVIPSFPLPHFLFVPPFCFFPSPRRQMDWEEVASLSQSSGFSESYRSSSIGPSLLLRPFTPCNQREGRKEGEKLWERGRETREGYRVEEVRGEEWRNCEREMICRWQGG